MRFRKLRIAWSVACVVACVLLIVLWVRSKTSRDRIVIPLRVTRFLRIDSSHGMIKFETYGQGMGEMSFSTTSLSHADISTAWKQFTSAPEPQDRKKWRWEVSRTGRFFVYLPHWFPVTILTAFAIAPWVPWRFSLRTLLIATTLVAVVLGLIVWAVR
jgi:hypothetical protein